MLCVRDLMKQNRIVLNVVRGLLSAALYMTAEVALASSSVADETHSWNIPATDAPAAVRAFGIQSGVAISGLTDTLIGKRLNAVTGTFTVDRALQQLVAGTGVTYRYDATRRAVTLTVASATASDVKSAPPPTTHRALTAGADTADAAVLLEEIVVTARKRLENLADVPISAQVVTGKTLSDYNIHNLTDLSQTLPGIQLNPTASSGQAFIRGIGSGGNYQFPQSVVTFEDDIAHERTRVADQEFLDLERVEVLKGPQTTLFGNNAIAGALNIVTAKPTDSFDGSVRALYGQYGQYAGEGMLNIPLGPDLAVRIAAVADGLSGWAQDPYAGHTLPDQNNKAGRITFRYRPTDDFDLILKLEGSSSHENDGALVGDCPPPAPFASASGAYNFCAATLKAGYPTRVSNFLDTTNAGQGIDLSSEEDVLTLNYHLANATLTSVTGWYGYHFKANVDADGTPAQLLSLQTREPDHQVSQEVRLASDPGQTWDYLVGLYAQNSHLGGYAQDITDFYLSSTIAKTQAYAALVPFLPLASVGPYDQAEHEYAAFASLGWNVTEQLRVGAGVRGTWDYKSASGATVYGTGTGAYGDFVPLPTTTLQTLAGKVLGTAKPAWSAKDSYNAGMPSADLEYKVVPSTMLYATYARGFLAGVPTDVGYVPPASGLATPPILPEYVNAYEVGAKSELFEHLRLSVDVFRSNYTNLQVASTEVTAAGTLVGEITNAASSRTQGVEFSAEWVLSGWRFSTAVTYLDARYLSYPNVTLTQGETYCRANPKVAGCVQEFPNGVPALQDLSGQPTEFAPTWSGSLTTSYAAALPHGLHLISEADVYASTWYFNGSTGTNDPELEQPGYARLDGRLALEGAQARWSVALVMKNLTGKLIYTGGIGSNTLPASSGSTLLQIEQPRNVAVEARWSF